MRASWFAAVLFVGAQAGRAGELVPPPQTPRPLQAAPAPISGRIEQGFDIESAEARLAEKLAELERLQFEIDALRAQIGFHSMVIAHVVLAEVDVDKLRGAVAELGADDARHTGLLLPEQAGPSRYCVVDAEAFREFIGKLQRRGLVNVLSEPKLLTVRNRAAQFDDGTTLVEFTPTSIGNQVRFDLRVRHAAPAVPPAGTSLPAGQEPPKQVREITTGGSLRAGKGLVLTGLTRTRSERDAEGHTTTRDVVLVGFVSIEQPLSTAPPTPLPPVGRKPERAALR